MENKKASFIPKILNISPGLIDIFKHILGGLYLGGAYMRGGLTLGGHSVLVSVYQNFKSIIASVKYQYFMQKKFFL